MNFYKAKTKLKELGVSVSENTYLDGSLSSVSVYVDMDLKKFNKHIQQFGMGMHVVYPNREEALKDMLKLIKGIRIENDK